MTSAALTGTATVVRLILRLDRIRLPIWIGALVGLVAWSAQAIIGIFSEAELIAYALTVESNAAIVALSGPPQGLTTFGGRTAFEIWPLLPFVALFGLFTVTRHTRREEEAGRTELLRATVLGSLAQPAAAFLVAVAGSVLLGALAAVALAVQGLPAGGSWTMGAALASVSIVFAGVGLVTAQVTEHARTASGMGVAVVGATYVLRAVGDIGSGALSWLSPFGWAQALRPFAGERPLVLAVPLVATVALVAVAVVLAGRRDVGAGLMRPRPGPPEASSALASPIGLAWRLQRGSVLAWTVGTALLGGVMASVADSADDIVGDNEEIRDFLASVSDAPLSDVFLATILLYVALLAAGHGVQSVLRARVEETTGRTEAVLATGVDRRTWLGAQLAVGLGGALLVLVVAAAAMGAVHGLVVGDLGQLLRLAGAGLGLLPAVGVAVAAPVALFGLRSSWAVGGWAVLVVSTLVGMFGDALDLPHPVRLLSPFHHLAAAPAEPMIAAPMVLLTLITGALLAVGVAGFARRDIG